MQENTEPVPTGGKGTLTPSEPVKDKAGTHRPHPGVLKAPCMALPELGSPAFQSSETQFQPSHSDMLLICVAFVGIFLSW